MNYMPAHQPFLLRQQSTAIPPQPAPITTPPRSPVCLHTEDVHLPAYALHLLQGAPQLPEYLASVQLSAMPWSSLEKFSQRW